MSVLGWIRQTAAILAAAFMALVVSPVAAQSPSCTVLALGQTQDITAHSVCKRVSLVSVPAPDAVSICVPTNTSAAEWQSFYDNPPAGVTIASCGTSCTGYSYGGYCYYWGNIGGTCDTVCASNGGCNLAGTRYVGSDDPSAARCSAVVSGIAGTAVTSTPSTGADAGCGLTNFKGGFFSINYHDQPTSCASAFGQTICACNDGSTGGQSCAFAGGGVVAHGQSITAYQTRYQCQGPCVSETRTCNNGVLSGSYTYLSCGQLNGFVDAGGYCWVQSEVAEACDSRCFMLYGIGGGVACDGNRIYSYAGGGGSNANCQTILNGLGMAGTGAPSTFSSAIGCAVTGTTRRRGTTGNASTTCAATAAGYRRACVCTPPT